MRSNQFLTMLAALLLVAASCTTSAAEQKPVNVLLLMNDQHRGDWLGAAGAAWIQTPHLDRLAKEGARFTRAYASAPSCLPARASLLTGQRPWSHGSLGYTAIPSRYQHEMPRMFTDAGYRTHAVARLGIHVNCGSSDMIEQRAERVPGANITLRVNPGFGHGHSQKTNTGGEGSKSASNGFGVIGSWGHLPLAAVRGQPSGLLLVR